MPYPTFKIITTEEHFVFKEISQKVLAFNTSKNTFNSSSNQVQKELMSIALPNIDVIEDVAAKRIKFMDDSGVDMQILSYGPGSPQNITDKILASDLCKQANNELARLIKTYPDKFSGLAVLPMADPIAASEELERSVNVLGLKGAMLSGTYNGCFFDHPQFLPVFYKAQDLNIPLYMHPAPIQENIADYYYQSDQWSAVIGAMFAGAGYGWHLDSGIGIIRLMLQVSSTSFLLLSLYLVTGVRWFHFT